MAKTKSKPVKAKTKPSHWLLKAYIYLLMFIQGMTVFIATLLLYYRTHMTPDQLTSTPDLLLKLPVSYFVVSIFTCIAQIYSLLTVLRSKRWGFWAFAFFILVGIGLSIYAQTPVIRAGLSLLSVVILFLLLHMGGYRSAWREMS